MFYHTIIVGAGPAGLYMAKLLQDHHIPHIIIEAFGNVGGQCQNIYPNKNMYDIPGLGAITGGEFIHMLLQSINTDHIRTNEKYISYDKLENGDFICTTSKNTYTSRHLIVATGMGECIFNKPSLKNLHVYENKQIGYFPENPHIYQNKKIIIFGGGDSALDAVEALYNNNSVTLVHRRNNFLAMSSKLALLSNIKVYTPYSVKELIGDSTTLNSVLITNEKEEVNLECHHIFFCYGYNTSKNNPRIKVNIVTMESDVNNLFAIGGASSYDQKRDLITTGMFEARLVLNKLLSPAQA